MNKILSQYRLSFLVAIGLLVAHHVLADSVRLHDQAGSAGPTITLAQVAEIQGDSAQDLGLLVVGAFGENAPTLRITLASVRDALARHEVNWGTLSLVGFNECVVHRILPDALSSSNQIHGQLDSENASAQANVSHALDLDTELTLRSHLMDVIARRADIDPGNLRVTFAPRDEERLAMGLLRYRFEVEPTTSNTVGRVPFRISRVELGRVVKTFAVTCFVQRRVWGIVATRSIHTRERFTEESIEVRELWLDKDGADPLGESTLVVGQIASRTIRSGSPIYPNFIRTPLLVHRGDAVSVRVMVGGLSVRTVAKATENGSLDDEIVLRRQNGRDTFTATVTGVREASIDLPPTQASLQKQLVATVPVASDKLSRTVASFRKTH